MSRAITTTPIAVRRAPPAPVPVRGPRSRLPRAIVATILLLTATASLGSVAAHQPILALAAVVAGLAAISVAIRPDVAALVVIGLIYSNAPVVLVTFQNLPVALAAAVPAFLVAPLAYDLLVERKHVVITPALPWIVVYFIVEIIATITARDINNSFGELITVAIEGVLLYTLLTNTVRTPGILRAIVWTLLLVGAAVATLSAYQYVTGTFGNNYLGFAQTEASVTGVTATGVERLAGPIGEKNRYAQIMLMLVPIGFLTFVAERRLILRLLALGSAGMCALAMALTFSRGAAVALAVVVLAMVALRYIRIRYLVAAVGIAAVVLAAVPQYADRVLTLTNATALLSDDAVGSGADNSLLSRATENLAALNVFADHPIVGVGPGQFSEYYREYADVIGLSVRAQDREAHNLYLSLAAESGVLGLGAFLVAVIVTLVGLARARRAALPTRPDLAALAAGFLLAIIAYLASGVFLHLSYARYYWMFLALGGAAAIIIRRTIAEEQAATLATAGAPAAGPPARRVRRGDAVPERRAEPEHRRRDGGIDEDPAIDVAGEPIENDVRGEPVEGTAIASPVEDDGGRASPVTAVGETVDGRDPAGDIAARALEAARDEEAAGAVDEPAGEPIDEPATAGSRAPDAAEAASPAGPASGGPGAVEAAGDDAQATMPADEPTIQAAGPTSPDETPPVDGAAEPSDPTPEPAARPARPPARTRPEPFRPAAKVTQRRRPENPPDSGS